MTNPQIAVIATVIALCVLVSVMVIKAHSRKVKHNAQLANARKSHSFPYSSGTSISSRKSSPSNVRGFSSSSKSNNNNTQTDNGPDMITNMILFETLSDHGNSHSNNNSHKDNDDSFSRRDTSSYEPSSYSSPSSSYSSSSSSYSSSSCSSSSCSSSSCSSSSD